MGEQGNSEVIIGETHFKTETPEQDADHRNSTPESEGKKGFAALIEKVKKGFSKGYEYMDAGVTPKQVPVEEINTETVAKAIRDYRLETGRFNKYDQEFAQKPFNAAELLTRLGYYGNWESGTTQWGEKHKEAYTAVRREIDNLVRSGAIRSEPEKEGNLDNENIRYRIADENLVMEAAAPPKPTGTE